MKRWSNFFAVTLLCSISFAELSGSTDSKFLTVGEISKIDVKNKLITINDAASYNIEQFSRTGDASGIAGGRSGGGAGTRGGRGGRRGGGASVPTTTGRGASAPIPMEFKVKVSAKTAIKEEDRNIKIEDLKIGDHIQVMSGKGGTKIDASEITRLPK
jgi:hypothetical protein